MPGVTGSPGCVQARCRRCGAEHSGSFCPADGADDRQHAGPRHGHQDEESALAHHRHPPRHDRWVPAMGSPARRVGRGVGAPRVSPAPQQRPPPGPAPLLSPFPRCSALQLGSIMHRLRGAGARTSLAGPPSPCVTPGSATLCQVPQPRHPCPVWGIPLHPTQAASVPRERHRGVAHPEVRHLRGG